MAEVTSLTAARRRVAVVGASGYIGGEMTRLLLAHPNVEVVAVTGRESAGKPLTTVHPNLLGTDLVLRPLNEIGEADVVFLALPNGEAMTQIDALPKSAAVIDASADFRLRDPAVYAATYRRPHTAVAWLERFVYGLPELFRADIRAARYVAAPGCFATAAALALYPLAAAGLIERAFINGVTGSSGAGVVARATTHHPFRADALFAYEPFTHRHVPEIAQTLKFSTGGETAFVFQPHSGPFVRGILVTAYVQLGTSLTQEDGWLLYAKRYADAPFVRLRAEPPDIKWVRGTNYCDLGVAVRDRIAIVWAALDNVIKGGAGQAIQCFNLMCSLPETTGLTMLALHP
ncbi:MAG: N-acetyl-gamma-glutamyl-phosphate reductase [Chloracidobacterium sp.]|uniref:N-acetyl-gamma-glutamyl-phosphate reductase n=1 Tax=Chloracidobacterium validum TaxID=2821543 RepID=A0ABX8BCI7_9BACT|nr:N-acetyl-gamma-glutamyl-phosphate reductase [Chloracidobacterium validum]QUW04631.1 N-acetyl-gamma-glutamyl-phosphate reductase [Chloracidobacterium validum]